MIFLCVYVYLHVCVFITLFMYPIYLSVDMWVVATSVIMMNSTAMNKKMQILLDPVFISFEYLLKSSITGSYGSDLGKPLNCFL